MNEIIALVKSLPDPIIVTVLIGNIDNIKEYGIE